ncbi:MAG TPA: phosphoribosylanthranilate isomerase [Verrucomicrobiota bacterium]|jgi:phosphoribosylanthranilate isomerase|nr:phosphoribosylanthranilate isomerase [Verrucomicrobiota bacterium]
MNPVVKICGLTRSEDVEAAIKAGATHIGFILAPSSKRYVPLKQLHRLSTEVPKGPVKKVGVFLNAPRDFILKHQEAGELDILQLHGDKSPDFARQFEEIEIWKAFHLRGEKDIEAALEYPARYILADSASAGSGTLCNWDYVAKLAAGRSVILAGGITPENAVEALRKTGACGIDLSTGVETSPGIKSKEKIEQLFKNLKTL